jgi:hypothetical protein
MASRKPHYTPDTETIFRLAREAWALSPEQIQSIQPGALGLQQLRDLLDVPRAADRPLAPKDRRGLDNPHLHLLRIMRDPQFFPFTCRHLFSGRTAAGPLDLMPLQHLALKELWWRQFPMLVATRGWGKSTCWPPRCCAHVHARGPRSSSPPPPSGRPSGVRDMERIWHNSPVFRVLVGSGGREARRKNGPRRDIDRVEFVIGDSVVIGLPLGDGQKIRGLRANYILTDEVASHPRGGLRDRRPGVRVGHRRPRRQRQGPRPGPGSSSGWACGPPRWTPRRPRSNRGNQSVLSGTAYYAFNHFCRYWREYKAVIETRGDPRAARRSSRGPPPRASGTDQYSRHPPPVRADPARVHGRQDGRPGQADYQHVPVRDGVRGGLPERLGGVLQAVAHREVRGRPAGDPRPADLPVVRPGVFTAAVPATPSRKYVYAVDPASERTSSPSSSSKSGPTTAASSTAGPPARATTARSSSRGWSRSTTSTVYASASSAT